MDVNSGLTNPTYLRTFFCARELQTKPKQDLSQKIYARTAQPARLPESFHYCEETNKENISPIITAIIDLVYGRAGIMSP